MKTIDLKKFALLLVSTFGMVVVLVVVGRRFWGKEQPMPEVQNPLTPLLSPSAISQPAQTPPSVQLSPRSATTSSTQPFSSPVATWEIYRNERYGFEFKYPSDDYNIIEEDSGEIVFKRLLGWAPQHPSLFIKPNKEGFSVQECLSQRTGGNTLIEEVESVDVGGEIACHVAGTEVGADRIFLIHNGNEYIFLLGWVLEKDGILETFEWKD